MCVDELATREIFPSASLRSMRLEEFGDSIVEPRALIEESILGNLAKGDRSLLSEEDQHK